MNEPKLLTRQKVSFKCSVNLKQNNWPLLKSSYMFFCTLFCIYGAGNAFEKLLCWNLLYFREIIVLRRECFWEKFSIL